MLENIRLSFQGIWAHKMRSFLTMLGIIIGIASIIAIVSTIKGTNEQIKQNVIGAGNNAVQIQLYQGDYEIEPAYTEIPSKIPVITEEVRQQIEAFPEVEEASLVYRRQEYDTVYNVGTSLAGGEVLGIDTHYLSVYGYKVAKGRLFVDRDYDSFRKVAILDTTASETLFPEGNPLGKTVEIKGEPFVVVGLVEQLQEFQPVINSQEDYYMYVQNQSGKVFLPSSVWPILYRYDEPQMVVARAASTDDMTAAGKKTADLLNANAGIDTNNEEDTIRYKGQDLLQRAKELQELSASTNQQLIWIASISLLVGGIGVMNIMLVSVTERTREIGLKKAIGARKRKILAQFLTEAAVLTSLGGLLGAAGGIGLAQIVSRVSESPVSISVPAMVFSVVFAMLIGILFGLLPSVKAANLNPIEALRYE